MYKNHSSKPVFPPNIIYVSDLIAYHFFLFFSVDFNRVFDFVPPTPRSAKLFGGASRDLDADRFARLSPRHSPRLNLPDTPTDLSCGRRLVENENIEAAEDLSMASKIAKDVSQHSAGHTNLELPVKTEYPRVKEEYRSR